jgi:quercetin dioxygenase-like cupin family protein
MTRIGSLALCVAFLYGCETLQPVDRGRPQTKTEAPKHRKPAGLGSISQNLAKGGTQPRVQKPVLKSAAPAPVTEADVGIDRMRIPPEADIPACVDLNDTLEKTPIDEKADLLMTRLGKVAAARTTLMQANGEIKARSTGNHDEIIYVIRGKAIIKIGEDRYRGASGVVFHLPRWTSYSVVPSEKPFVALVIEVLPADSPGAGRAKTK